MKRILTIILLVIAGCSSEDKQEPKFNLVDRSIYSGHISDFYNEAKTRGLTLPVIEPEVRYTNDPSFGKEPCSEAFKISLSHKEGNKYIIEVSDLFKEQKNPSYYQGIIYRELAHLLLNKEYTYSCNLWSVPQIMCPCMRETTLTKEVLDLLFKL